jgi:flagellar hook-associated protein 3 FlgL
MRVTSLMLFNNSEMNVNNHYEELFKLNEQVTTGKRINRPSDDPVDAGKVSSYKTLLDSIDQYGKNIDQGDHLLRTTESALANIEEILIESKVLAEQMATGTYSDEQREMLSLQAEQMYDHIVQIGNTKVGGRYIFSGYKTDTQPFSRDEYFNISYHGDDNELRFEISQDIHATVNITGQKMLIDGTSVFDVLQDLHAALKNMDQQDVGETLPRITDALNKIISQRSTAGMTLKQLESTQGILEDLGLQTNGLLSDTEDTDMIEVLTKLRTREIAFEATLKSTSMVTGLSLVNFV